MFINNTIKKMSNQKKKVLENGIFSNLVRIRFSEKRIRGSKAELNWNNSATIFEETKNEVKFLIHFENKIFWCIIKLKTSKV